MKFPLVSQNSDLSSKLDSTRQNKNKGMCGFQNRTLEAYKLKFKAKRCKGIISKNKLFNRNLFDKSEKKFGKGLGF